MRSGGVVVIHVRHVDVAQAHCAAWTLRSSAAKWLSCLDHPAAEKSTLLNIMGGLDRASSGHLFFKDLELTGLDERNLTAYRRKSVGSFSIQPLSLTA
jgi:putative ABC transport system ATP-binding protein